MSPVASPLDHRIFGNVRCAVAGDRSAQRAIVLCHGYGAEGATIAPLGQELVERLPPGANAYRVICPDGFTELPELGLAGARGWWRLSVSRLLAQQGPTRPDDSYWREEDPPELEALRVSLQGLFRDLASEGIPSERIVLGGFSQGAVAALDFAMHSPGRFAGLLLFSSAFIRETAWRAALPRLSGLPVLQSHGERDGILPFSNARALHALLRSSGVNAEFLPFQGGHEIPEPVLARAADFVRHLDA